MTPLEEFETRQALLEQKRTFWEAMFGGFCIGFLLMTILVVVFEPYNSKRNSEYNEAARNYLYSKKEFEKAVDALSEVEKLQILNSK